MIVCDSHELPSNFGDFEFRGVKYKMLVSSGASFADYTHSDISSTSSLHKLIYDHIQDELPAALNQLRKLEGLREAKSWR